MRWDDCLAWKTGGLQVWKTVWNSAAHWGAGWVEIEKTDSIARKIYFEFDYGCSSSQVASTIWIVLNIADELWTWIDASCVAKRSAELRVAAEPRIADFASNRKCDRDRGFGWDWDEPAVHFVEHRFRRVAYRFAVDLNFAAQ